jgi:putative two-component system response regulator
MNSVIAIGTGFPRQVSALRVDGSILHVAETLDSALRFAEEFPCILLFLNDFETVDAVKRSPLKDLPFLFLANDSRAETELRAFEAGAADVLLPPWNSDILLRRARQQLEAFRRKEAEARLEAKIGKLEAESGQLRSDLAILENRVFDSESQRQAAVNEKRKLENDVRMLQSSTKELEDNVISSFADLLEYRDNETGGHVVRTSKIVGLLGSNLVMDSVYSKDILNWENIDLMSRAAPLHDVGKVGIHDRILLKPGSLTRDEFEEMKKHTTIGGKILQQLLDKMPSQRYLEYAQRIALNHHERWDGSGYPNRVAGDLIPIEARIMSVADVYDALVSDRVYRPAMSREEAVKLITAGKGTQFDPRIIEVFEECEPELNLFYKSCPSDRGK